ncbi:hypothetical protein F3I62_15340 [Pseudomonas sp. R-28-1W-6]|uniref:hypothetical protein n=1 Tax=Pseudomonas sp. R-28-1W-6 TaxID=2650101 RepID=UPI0013661959|nr:hypothetical protein [Pseudomonas sp. R-28-1W-6]MWV13477.1 hypothetical protein [Pseudomonas sp. R-28-1W-6]
MDIKKAAGIAGSAAATMFIPGGFLVGPVAAIAAALAASQDDIKEAENKSLESLEAEARKQQIVMDFQAHQARVAQEISIAQRIASSEEVEIEEYYDTSGKANAGLKAEKESLTLGLAGEGRKVTKRVIKFKGWSPLPSSEDSAEV